METIANHDQMELSSLQLKLSFDKPKTTEHELEYVTTRSYVEYINDSKSTTVNATWYALSTMTKPVIWIAGGILQNPDFGPIKELVKKKVKAIIYMGVDSSPYHKEFGKDVPMIISCPGIGDAIYSAKQIAEYHDVVLFSPCGASFDMFNDYKDRGRKFKNIVMNLV